MLRHIAPSEYETVIDQHVTDMIICYDDKVVHNAERWAVAKLKSYLNKCFDTTFLKQRVFDWSFKMEYKKGDWVIDQKTCTYYICIKDAPAATPLHDEAYFYCDDETNCGTCYDYCTEVKQGEVYYSQHGGVFIAIADAPAGTKLTDLRYFAQRRDETIIGLIMDMAIYRYHNRTESNAIPQHRQLAYEMAQEDLNRISRGHVCPDGLLQKDKDGDGIPDNNKGTTIISEPPKRMKWSRGSYRQDACYQDQSRPCKKNCNCPNCKKKKMR